MPFLLLINLCKKWYETPQRPSKEIRYKVTNSAKWTNLLEFFSATEAEYWFSARSISAGTRGAQSFISFIVLSNLTKRLFLMPNGIFFIHDITGGFRFVALICFWTDAVLHFAWFGVINSIHWKFSGLRLSDPNQKKLIFLSQFTLVYKNRNSVVLFLPRADISALIFLYSGKENALIFVAHKRIGICKQNLL